MQVVYKKVQTIGDTENRVARLDFAKKYLKNPQKSWNQIVWTEETKVNLR